MKVIVCLDNFGGMMFNRRRQSRDRNVVDDIISLIAEKPLYLSAYSARLFENTECKNIIVSEDFLDLCVCDGYAFVEDRLLLKYKDKIDSVITYLWNRDYPCDMKLDLLLSEPEWNLVENVDFSGYSHDLITRKTYVKS